MTNDFSRNYTRTNIIPIRSDLTGLAAREAHDKDAREQIAKTLAARERIERMDAANRYLALKRYNVWWRRALRALCLS
jgi:hypothetical protein